MAKSKRTSKPKSKSSKPQVAYTTGRQIGENDLRTLMRRVRSLAQQSRSTSGEAGELVKSAIENKNLDRPAFNIVKQLVALGEKGGGKLNTTLACVRYYIDVLELDKKATQQAELAIKRQEAGEVEEGDPSQRKPQGDLRPAHLRSINGGAHEDQEPPKVAAG